MAPETSQWGGETNRQQGPGLASFREESLLQAEQPALPRLRLMGPGRIIHHHMLTSTPQQPRNVRVSGAWAEQTTISRGDQTMPPRENKTTTTQGSPRAAMAEPASPPPPLQPPEQHESGQQPTQSTRYHVQLRSQGPPSPPRLGGAATRSGGVSQ